jgi:hypothetical protein
MKGQKMGGRTVRRMKGTGLSVEAALRSTGVF